MNNNSGETNFEYYSRILKIKYIVFGILALILIGQCWGTIQAGHKGVLLQMNGVTGKILNEGFYIKAPFIQDVKQVNIQTQKEQTDSAAASKDLQDVSATVALNYRLDQNQVANLWKTIGADYSTKIIDPAMQEAVKSITANFTAEELITKRETVREDIKILLAQKLEKYFITVEEFNIVNFNFSPEFNAAIEAKVTAEQNAFAAKNKLEQVKYEAQQAVEAANGKAKALQIEGQALKENSQIAELRWIEKWDGKTPTYWGNATPFIGLSK